MRDLWAFLLQTLTASGAAALLLAVKALFRDKLPPRWQFSVWGVLGLVLLVPAGLGGRYVLVNWPYYVEALRTLLAGEYLFTRVTAPIPLPPAQAPDSLWDWLFLVYFAGVLLLLLTHTVSYFRLRLALRRGSPADPETTARIRTVAERYGLTACPAVRVPGLPTAFVCGLIHPILALPGEGTPDEKVLLHELLHRSHHDTAWSMVLCLFRCVHWCNPLLWYCADQAGNDLEALCDQRVLEKLEGEERRDYGRILLSMANEQYARAAGTSSLANGGKNIRRRIEAIARFKRYPAGMGLVSVCVALSLGAPLVMGAQSEEIPGFREDRLEGYRLETALAKARTLPCTTEAGALDTYAKALISRQGAYRAMCLREADMEDLARQLKQEGGDGYWEGLFSRLEPDCTFEEYAIYNLEPAGKDAYEGLLVLPMQNAAVSEEQNMMVALQRVRTEREGGRWIVEPLEELTMQEIEKDALSWGSRELPFYRYTGEAEDFRLEICHQRVFNVKNEAETENDMSWFFGMQVTFDKTAKPRAQFSDVMAHQWERAVYLGEHPEQYHQIGLSVRPQEAGEERPELMNASGTPGSTSGSSSNGEDWASRKLPQDWGPVVNMGGGGGGLPYDSDIFQLPDHYAADFYLNGEKVAQLDLTREEATR